MNKFAGPRLAIAMVSGLGLTLALAVCGCGGGGGRGVAPTTRRAQDEAKEQRNRDAILKNVVQLIRRAADNPGGDEFRIATENLNEYFAGTDSAQYKLSDASRKLFGLLKTPPAKVSDLESQVWSPIEARHIEDCLMYRLIASRAAGNGDTLTRVRRAFDWTIKQIMLAPPEWQAVRPESKQAESRPYDVMIRGIAVEEGLWAERSWVFMALCRQLSVDAGLLVVETPNKGQRFACCVAIVDGKPHLFDLRYGLEIAGPNGEGVAAVDQAVSDPAILDRMNLPNAPYPISALDLATGKLIILVDSSPGYFKPKMKLLENSLAADARMILFRDAAEQAGAFMKALGDRCEVSFWDLPTEIERRLFTEPGFVRQSQEQMLLFSPQFKLLPARIAQLRGDLGMSKTLYVNLRFAEDAQIPNSKLTMPPQLQHEFDLYATYFLGLAQLETKNNDTARRMFEQTLKFTPMPGRGLPPTHLYRLGAQANLARLNEADGKIAEAIRDYSMPDPSPQGAGNSVKARDLVFRDPFAPLAPTRTAPPQ